MTDLPEEVSKEQLEFSRRRFLRYAGGAAVAGTAAGGLAGILGDQSASAATLVRANSDSAFFAGHPKYKFVMICHVTTNSFFTATIYGIQDACAITGSTYQWTGSENSLVLRDGVGVQQRHRREGERHRVLPHRQHRVQCPHRQPR